MRALEHELAEVTSENDALRRSVNDLHADVKRLRDEAKNEFKVDESYLVDAKTADGGTPPDEEDEESP